MKFLKLALIVSCVLSAVLSRRSHSKAPVNNSVSYKSKALATDKVCIKTCTNFKTSISQISCSESSLDTENRCVCSPKKTETTQPGDICEYVSSVAPSSEPDVTTENIQVKNRRRRRY